MCNYLTMPTDVIQLSQELNLWYWNFPLLNSFNLAEKRVTLCTWCSTKTILQILFVNQWFQFKNILIAASLIPSIHKTLESGFKNSTVTPVVMWWTSLLGSYDPHNFGSLPHHYKRKMFLLQLKSLLLIPHGYAAYEKVHIIVIFNNNRWF